MQQINTKKVVLISLLATISLCSNAQQIMPTVTNSAPILPAASVMPGITQPILNAQSSASSQTVGTLKRIEAMQRELVEANLKEKLHSASGTPLPGFSSLAAGPGIMPTLQGASQPPISILPTPPAPKVDQTLEDYQTISVVNFMGVATADLSFPGGMTTVKVGDSIDGWIVSRVSIEGVQVQRRIAKTKKIAKTITYTLKPSRAVRDTFIQSSTVSGVIQAIPAYKPVFPDSTGVQLSGK